MKVAGIDGCKKGWIAVVLDVGLVVEVKVFESFGSALEGLGEIEFLAIDIPIGLSDSGGRLADIQARRHLGSRASSVFMVPPRRVLEAPDYGKAKALAEPGKKPSLQLFGIREKILEVNDHPLLDDRVFEVHPEVSFCEMAGKPLPSKRSWNGLWMRIDLLAKNGIEIPKTLGDGAGEAGPDDVLDAAAAAWTALRMSEARAAPLPDPPEKMGRRRVAIWR